MERLSFLRQVFRLLVGDPNADAVFSNVQNGAHQTQQELHCLREVIVLRADDIDLLARELEELKEALVVALRERRHTVWGDRQRFGRTSQTS